MLWGGNFLKSDDDMDLRPAKGEDDKDATITRGSFPVNIYGSEKVTP
jgi:hypothetical protein